MDAADQELKQRASTCAIKVSTVFLKIGRSSCKHFFWLMLMSASLSKPSGGLGTGPWSRCSQPKRWSSSFFIILTMVMQDQNERKQSVSSSQPTAARISRAAFRLQSNSSWAAKLHSLAAMNSANFLILLMATTMLYICRSPRAGSYQKRSSKNLHIFQVHCMPLSTPRLSIDLSIDLSICLSIYQSIYPSIYRSNYLSIYLSIYRSNSFYIYISLSLCLSLCLSVYRNPNPNYCSYKPTWLSFRGPALFGKLCWGPRGLSQLRLSQIFCH